MDYYFVEHGPTKWHAQEILMTSADVTLPTTVPPGSVAYTADGSKNYMYDGTQWVERTTGGGGGGGGASVTTVTDNEGTLSMTAGALLTAFKAGPVVLNVEYLGGTEGNYSCIAATNTGTYRFLFIGENDGELMHVIYDASTSDDYPAAANSGGGGDLPVGDLPIGGN